MSNLTARILVSLVGIPIILLLTMAGGFYFLALIMMIASVGLSEFYGLAKTKGIHPQSGLGSIFGSFVVVTFLHNKLQYLTVDAFVGGGVPIPFPTMTQLLLIELMVFVPLMLLRELFRDKGSAIENIGATLSGVLYVSFFLGTLVGLRELFIPADFPVYRFFHLTGVSVPSDIAETVYAWGGWTVVSVFVSIWFCDSGAYFVGKTFGRHKMLERVSPKKTWEGAIAGFVLAVATFLLAKILFLAYLSYAQAFVCGAIVGVFGQFGDLVESLLKRDAGVKDSSTILPGHGGALDRFDSLIFIGPLLFLYLDFIVF